MKYRAHDTLISISGSGRESDRLKLQCVALYFRNRCGIHDVGTPSASLSLSRQNGGFPTPKTNMNTNTNTKYEYEYDIFITLIS